MVEKHYCDACGKETPHDENLQTQRTASTIETKYDVCDDCLLKKSIAQILREIDDTKASIVTIDLPYNFIKEKKEEA